LLKLFACRTESEKGVEAKKRMAKRGKDALGRDPGIERKLMELDAGFASTRLRKFAERNGAHILSLSVGDVVEARNNSGE